MMLKLLLAEPGDGVMIPIPQYPLYSAGLALNGGRPVPYFLDESKGWTTSAADLEEALSAAEAQGTRARALAVINPGNPTGQCMSEADVRETLSFCARHGLVAMADEVYQENIWRKGERPFVSFKRVLRDMERDGEVEQGLCQLVSFHSVSKGVFGECGRRGGYMEMCNIASDVQDQVYKLASVNLCSNVEGQLMVGLMVNPPAGDSKAAHEAEVEEINASLQRRAALLVETLNEMEGVSCERTDGALYVFPTIELPPRALEEAKRRGEEPDFMYCMDLLDATGIVVVPGSGFGQKSGTLHFRTTILPPEERLSAVVGDLKAFHAGFMEKYR